MSLKRTMAVHRRSLNAALQMTVIIGGVTLLLLACGEDEVSRGVDREDGEVVAKSKSKASKGKRTKRGKNSRRNKAGAPPEIEDEPMGPAIDRELPEAVFIETDENRDPFRSFLPVFSAQALPEEELAPRPPVLLEDVSLDELQLIAIVSGEGGNPRAMVVDPEGKGWIVQRGDYVGRGERIRLGPGLPEREINWRVVRVRPDRIILVREDPVQQGPPVTRVMRLYPEEEN